MTGDEAPNTGWWQQQAGLIVHAAPA